MMNENVSCTQLRFEIFTTIIYISLAYAFIVVPVLITCKMKPHENGATNIRNTDLEEAV